MLTEKDKIFLKRWEKERNRENNVLMKIANGLPMAMLFSLPIILLIFVVYYFFPEWYTRISGTSQGTFIIIVIAVLISTVFFSYFRMHYKWEMNEQLYMELKKKEARDEQQSNISTPA